MRYCIKYWIKCEANKRMKASFDLEQYLSSGIENIVRGAIRATLKNPKETAFLLQYAAYAKAAATRRLALAAEGEHIPSFLIASITTRCNLHCAGCYDQANHGCEDDGKAMSAGEWADVFAQAREAGVAMILLAGGEPLLRRDVLKQAARVSQILFPVFTNGTLLDEEAFQLFEAHRNLVPIVSIEGDEIKTDARRGGGVYGRTRTAMARLQKADLLFGAAITVTRENIEEVTGPGFAGKQREKGCRVLLYVEYVPVDSRDDLALDKEGIVQLAARVAALRAARQDMIFISFPGDEKEAGGCLAAGRGFMHINAAGGAEPCPFSPYSDTSLRRVSLRQALLSPLFGRLRDAGLLQQPHTGGCVLYQHEDEVRRLVKA